MLATVCDPWLHKNLHGIPDEVRERLWKLFHKAVADQAVENDRRASQPIVIPPSFDCSSRRNQRYHWGGQGALRGVVCSKQVIQQRLVRGVSATTATTGSQSDEDQ